MRIDAAGLTDKGSVRENNEDAFLADSQAGLFLVADGMGGLDAGEIASRIAVETVAARLMAAKEAHCQDTSQALERLVAQAFEEANERIHRFARQGAGPAGTGTTLVGLVRCGDQFVLANVGDSRAYLIKDQDIRQLSEDHSLVMARVRQGLITPEEAARSPEKNVIYRALGMESNLQVDTCVVQASAGDVFLLCSDGLSDVLADHELLAPISQSNGAPLSDICTRFIDLALERKARDNVTVVLVRCLP
ncbi:MAG: Stp1/IreP family PP2C-type Ser/Thr phosphatase [Desulfovibrio sp.]|nr:Stp1/IreP family PP2C-type Ser/Thr phosphatase [Desulfovibrio sp.]MBI4958454.1 Stp1/IreP family PP2C-type Ser/Thr phosphatase [Desulfovibrio sp.]